VSERTTLYEVHTEEISALLVGRKVTKVSGDTLLLDNGVVLVLTGNDGGCSCGAGDYELVELNGIDNIITRVELVNDPDGEDHPDGGGTYQIFVFADNEKVNLARFEGSDGNGYYGTGYTIEVKPPTGVTS
jgi:hypothetical protein